ncbi:MAG: hypothetical protein DMF60_20350 [Acidobacteria bacterium]|nr:MAG: hypothetical protein DMF60_20350 [Acidobacteriota bacterium]
MKKPGLRSAAAGSFFVVLLAGCASIGEKLIKPAPEPTAVVALIDFSGSVKPETVRFYADTIASKVLMELTARDRLTLLPIDSRSESRADPFFAVDFARTNFSDPHDGVAHKEQKERARLDALIAEESKNLKEAISAEASARSGFKGGTDLIGALHSAVNNFPEGDAYRRVLLIFSDMIHEGRDLDLRTLRADDVSAQAAIKQLEADKRIPNLNGVVVAVIGAGERDTGAASNPAYFRAVRTFWMEFFARAGATLAERDYGYRTQDVIPALLHK